MPRIPEDDEDADSKLEDRLLSVTSDQKLSGRKTSRPDLSRSTSR